jgi:transcriptional regulator with XRE-family HTH domain
MKEQLTRAIKKAIKESGMIPFEIATRAGVEPASLSRFMHGKRSLGLPAAEKLCDLLGLELRQIRKPKRKAKD